MTRLCRETLISDGCKTRKHSSREARWHGAQFAWQTVGKAGEMGSLAISSYSNRCKHVPKDDVRHTVLRRRGSGW